MVIGGGVSRIWELSNVSLDVLAGFLLVCNKMEVQVICARSMQLTAGMCLEGQCVNAIPLELR